MNFAAPAGWLGIAMPTAYGGGGLEILEAALMMEAVSGLDAGLSDASAIHMKVFSPHPVGPPWRRRAEAPLVAAG